MLSAGLGFLGGVLVCALLAIIVLPAVIRSQCAKTVRLYHEFLRPQNTTPVIVIERDAATQSPSRANAVVRRRISLPANAPDESTLRVDSPLPAPSMATNGGQGSEEASILRHVYEQNVRLREQFAQQSSVTAPETSPRGGPRIDP